MIIRPAIGGLLAVSMVLLPATAYAQAISLTRSVQPDQPYTIIYPDTMTVQVGVENALTINHPDAPLQCDLSVVTVEDTSWTPENALASLDDAEVTAAWTTDFPGFALGAKSVTAYQSGPALLYDGQSTNSPMGVPVTIVHTETVAEGLGYSLDCLFSTAVEAQARPIVDFIVANFSTRADAECCVAADAATAPAL